MPRIKSQQTEAPVGMTFQVREGGDYYIAHEGADDPKPLENAGGEDPETEE